MKHTIAALGAALILAAGVAQAQEESAPAQSSDAVREVVVTGARPLDQQVTEFVNAVAVPGDDDQLAAWRERICPGVFGARNVESAQALIDRIALRAYSLDLRVGQPGCTANVLMFLTDDSDRFAGQFVSENEALFSVNEETGGTAGTQALSEFVSTPRPVRWWHVTQTVTDRGQVLSGSSDARPSGDGLTGVEVARVSRSSRLLSGTSQELNRVLIIIDTSRIGDVGGGQLGDYLAMAALAQIAPDPAPRGAPSILTLFVDREAGRPAQEGWTAWDQAYLEGLYSANRFARSSRQQQGQIESSMRQDLGDPNETQSDPEGE